uniref:Uncharacterized protein n=1 Tax=Zea mays TaxID=4577 RepID=B6U682_MAIZE|nr:hypothetical protein [Zea mays]
MSGGSSSSRGVTGAGAVPRAVVFLVSGVVGGCARRFNIWSYRCSQAMDWRHLLVVAGLHRFGGRRTAWWV